MDLKIQPIWDWSRANLFRGLEVKCTQMRPETHPMRSKDAKTLARLAHWSSVKASWTVTSKHVSIFKECHQAKIRVT